MFSCICICLGTYPGNPTVDFLGFSLRAERRQMHLPTNLPTKSEAACCTVRVFNTGAMWISMLCAGLLTLSGWSSENIALLCVGFAWHGFACFLAFAFAWGPTLKILLWCDESLPILGAPVFARKVSWATGGRCFFEAWLHTCPAAPVWSWGPSTMFEERLRMARPEQFGKC